MELYILENISEILIVNNRVTDPHANISLQKQNTLTLILTQ